GSRRARAPPVPPPAGCSPRPLPPRGPPAITCSRRRLYRSRHLNRWQRLRQAVRPWSAHQHLGLHQRTHALLQEKGITLSAHNQELLERRQAVILAQQGLQEFVSTGGRQGVEPELRVVGLA